MNKFNIYLNGKIFFSGSSEAELYNFFDAIIYPQEIFAELCELEYGEELCEQVQEKEFEELRACICDTETLNAMAVLEKGENYIATIFPQSFLIKTA